MVTLDLRAIEDRATSYPWTPDTAFAGFDLLALLAALRSHREALTALHNRHNWQPGAGRCVCKEHEAARAVLATVTEGPTKHGQWLENLATEQGRSKPGDPGYPPADRNRKFDAS